MIGSLLWISGLLIALLTLILALTYTPSVDSDAMNAPSAQRIFYWHVPAAWASFLAFTLLFVGSIAWFWRRIEWGWHLHIASSEAGLLFGSMVIISGPIWGAAEWDVPWDWTDVRLNTYAVLVCLSAFLVLGRKSQPDGEDTRDTFSSIGLFGFVLVPLTYVATRFWEKRHPGPVVGPGGGGLETEMLQVLALGAVGFTMMVMGQIVLLMYLTKQEMRIEKLQKHMDETSS